MRVLLLILASAVLLGCGSSSPTAPALEAPAAEAASPATAQAAAAAAEPTPEAGPAYWRAWIDADGMLHHENLSAWTQEAVACYYRVADSASLRGNAQFVRPHDEGTIPLHGVYLGCAPIAVEVLAFVKPVDTARHCTADQRRIGNITAHRVVEWPGC